MSKKDYLVRVRRSTDLVEGPFTWEISRNDRVIPEVLSGIGFATEKEARMSGERALDSRHQNLREERAKPSTPRHSKRTQAFNKSP